MGFPDSKDSFAELRKVISAGIIVTDGICLPSQAFTTHSTESDRTRCMLVTFLYNHPSFHFYGNRKNERLQPHSIHHQMSLYQMRRENLHALTLYNNNERDVSVRHIVIAIYSSVLRSATMGKRVYTYCIPRILTRPIVRNSRDRDELIADVMYDVTVLFPDSKVTYRPCASYDTIRVEWS